MRLLLAASTSALLALGITAQAAEKPAPAGSAAPMMSVDTPTFVKAVAGANEFEIQSSKLAETKSQKGDIKKVAAVIIADHTKAGEKLKATLAADKTAALPEPAGLSPKEEKMLAQLNAAEGADFDTLYVDMQAQAHMEAVALFRTYAGSGDNAAVVGFAKETLPVLEMHLKHVDMVAKAG